VLDRGVQIDAAFADQLEHHDGGERLGVAAEAHLAVAGNPGARGVVADPAVGAADRSQRAREAVLAHQVVQVVLNRRGRGDQSTGGQRADDQVGEKHVRSSFSDRLISFDP
jgi:hypothetical protein